MRTRKLLHLISCQTELFAPLLPEEKVHLKILDSTIESYSQSVQITLLGNSESQPILDSEVWSLSTEKLLDKIKETFGEMENPPFLTSKSNWTVECTLLRSKALRAAVTEQPNGHSMSITKKFGNHLLKLTLTRFGRHVQWHQSYPPWTQRSIAITVSRLHHSH